MIYIVLVLSQYKSRNACIKLYINKIVRSIFVMKLPQGFLYLVYENTDQGQLTVKGSSNRMLPRF